MGYYWLKFATNQSECESWFGCAENRVEGNLITFKPRNDCMRCNANYIRLFNWTRVLFSEFKMINNCQIIDNIISHSLFFSFVFIFFYWQGVWTPGYVKSLVWMQRNYSSVNSIARTINYTFFRQEINRAIATKISFSYITDALCRYGNIFATVGDLLCDCMSGYSDTSCYSGATSTLIGVLKGCPYISSTIHVHLFYSITITLFDVMKRVLIISILIASFSSFCGLGTPHPLNNTSHLYLSKFVLSTSFHLFILCKSISSHKHDLTLFWNLQKTWNKHICSGL
jgi:hypothetical protein